MSLITSKKISKVYLGSKMLYSSGNVVTYQVDSNTNTKYTEEFGEGENVLSPKTFVPYKSGWTFVGWSKGANSSTETSLNMGNEPITLYAVFKQEVTVSYYQVSNSTKQKSVKYRYYNNGNIENPKFTISPSGYGSEWTFRGWTTGTAANASVSYSSISNREFTSDVTLYVLLQRPVTLSYNGNGASSGSVDSETKYVYLNSYGTNTVLNPTFKLASNGYSRTDHIFLGWDLGAVGASITLDSNRTAYAQWKSNIMFSNGTLGSGISVSGASISGGKIFKHIGSGADDEGNTEAVDCTVTISGLDLTNYSKLYISSTHDDVNAYGESYCNVGIDSANTRFFTGNDVGTVTKTIMLDVSGYTGVHTLKFYLYARSDSSYSGYHTNCQIGITEIKLIV